MQPAMAFGARGGNDDLIGEGRYVIADVYAKLRVAGQKALNSAAEADEWLGLVRPGEEAKVAQGLKSLLCAC